MFQGLQPTNKKLFPGISALLDMISAVRGSILYRGASGWAALPPGTAGDVLNTNGVGADPTWETPAAGGGVALTRVSLSAPIASVGAQSAVAFDTEEIDQNLAWDVGSPGQFTIPSNGTYRVQLTCTGYISAGTGVNYWAELQLLATTITASNYLTNATDFPSYGWITATLTKVFAAGDVIALLCSRLSGAGGPDMTISAGSFATLEKLG